MKITIDITEKEIERTKNHVWACHMTGIKPINYIVLRKVLKAVLKAKSQKRRKR